MYFQELHRPEFDFTIDFSLVDIDNKISLEYRNISLDISLDQESRVERHNVDNIQTRIDFLGDVLDSLQDYYNH